MYVPNHSEWGRVHVHKDQVYLITPNGGGYIACETLQCSSKISNISGRHARDTDTGPWHIAYRLGLHDCTKKPQSGGGSPTSQGPRWSFVNFFYQHANDQSCRTPTRTTSVFIPVTRARDDG